MLANGATTAWEGWTGQSHIHDTLISIGAWFIQGMGGIRADEKAPGFKHFFVKPAVVGDLTSARASYRSIRGEIVSDWRIENGQVTLECHRAPRHDGHRDRPGQGGRQHEGAADRHRPGRAAGASTWVQAYTCLQQHSDDSDARYAVV